jgi:adenylate cyclase class 2
MKYEVEQKFPVVDLATVEDRLRTLGATFGRPIVQLDRYFAHPSRDFAATDEALRIRQVGDRYCITYKGPKVDAATKTRQEIELPLADGPDVASRWTSLLQSLGFSPAAEVRKRRRPGRVVWQDRNVEVALDDVDRLGTFVELELSVEAASLESAKTCVLSLARELGLSDAERRSYLELLLSKSPP